MRVRLTSADQDAFMWAVEVRSIVGGVFRLVELALLIYLVVKA